MEISARINGKITTLTGNPDERLRDVLKEEFSDDRSSGKNK